MYLLIKQNSGQIVRILIYIHQKYHPQLHIYIEWKLQKPKLRKYLIAVSPPILPLTLS